MLKGLLGGLASNKVVPGASKGEQGGCMQAKQAGWPLVHNDWPFIDTLEGGSSNGQGGSVKGVRNRALNWADCQLIHKLRLTAGEHDACAGPQRYFISTRGLLMWAIFLLDVLCSRVIEVRTP